MLAKYEKLDVEQMILELLDKPTDMHKLYAKFENLSFVDFFVCLAALSMEKSITCSLEGTVTLYHRTQSGYERMMTYFE